MRNKDKTPHPVSLGTPRWGVFAVLAVCAVPVSQGAATATSCNTTPPIPAPPANAKVLEKSPGGDDTATIQNALNSLQEGEWLVVPAGHYTITKHLTIPVTGVTVYGKGAVVRSTNPADGGLMIEADNVSVLQFTVDQDSNGRKAGAWTGGISVYDERPGGRRRVSGAMIRGNTINNAAAAGIFLYKATNFTVADNTVFRSWADGIHATGGSSDGRVIHNKVSQNGDDMVAVVSYAGSRTAASMAERFKVLTDDSLDKNIYIAENDLTDTYWGRGVSVVGGQDVTIENNHISKTPTAAGVYILREGSYVTFGDRNILIRNNDVSQTETEPPTYKPPNINLVLTHHAAIEISAQLSPEEFADPRYRDELSVSDIAIIDNKVNEARFAGLRIGAVSGVDKTVRNILVKGNSFQNIGVGSIAAVYPGVDASTLNCQQNTLNGTLWDAQCDQGVARSSVTPNVTGASLTCMSDGTVRRSGHHPNPPSGLGVN